MREPENSKNRDGCDGSGIVDHSLQRAVDIVSQILGSIYSFHELKLISVIVLLVRGPMAASIKILVHSSPFRLVYFGLNDHCRSEREQS